MEINQAQDEEGELVVVGEQNTEIFMVTQYVKELKEHLRAVYKVVETNRDCKVEKSKIYYDRNIKPMEYQVGELVMLNKPSVKTGQSKKLVPKWEGPYCILEKIGPVNYKIKKYQQKNSKIILIHHNRLKKFFGSTSAPLNDDEVVEIKAKTSKKNKKLRSSLPVPARGKGRAGATRSERVSNTKTLEVSPTAVLESTDEDETYKPSKYLKKRLNEARSPGTRRSQRVRKPVDRLKL
ncbi:Gap-Pol poly [Brachionus plicatilis]|uniref:Gap-Pol poly n=1 Tax=Brachionus plicatilis TaxID=10195 RepID=A0A3M7T7B0_BRAPC|nr:Gap-Pol poly [Brachionus plicatilis]